MKPMMNEADMYQKSNTLQKRDALQCLEENSFRIKWKNYGDRVVDIGCGDGSVTSDVLKAFMPENFNKLVGCDISQNMVKFANEQYKDARTSFRLCDIGDELPADMKRCFDHAFSFYALHWVLRQEQAFGNIYNMLSEGGDCLVTFLGHMPLYNVYRIMARSDKWQPWINDVEKYVSPYHDSQEPEKEVSRLMEKVGFKNVYVKCKERLFKYDNLSLLKKAILAVNPFNIPKELQDDFIEEYLDVVRDMRLLDEQNNNLVDAVSIRVHYTLLVAYGTR